MVIYVPVYAFWAAGFSVKAGDDMAMKWIEVRERAVRHAAEVTASPEAWMGFLGTMAQCYQYSFANALLIHAQRSDATVCATFDDWKIHARRSVVRGSKGIGLVRREGGRERLYYVFDVKDTCPLRGAVDVTPWRIRPGQDQALYEVMAPIFPQNEGITNLRSLLADISIGMALEIAPNHDNRVNLLASSSAYILLRRCGFDPMGLLPADSFDEISKFHELGQLAELGVLIRRITKPLLQTIGTEIRRLERRDKRKEQGKSSLQNREETDHGDRIHSAGRVSDTEPNDPGRGNGDEDNRQVRADAGKLSEKPQGGDVLRDAAAMRAGRPSGGHRGGSVRTRGEGGGSIDRAVPAPGQGSGHPEMGGAHERPAGNGGGRGDTGDHLQVATDPVTMDGAGMKSPAFLIPENTAEMQGITGKEDSVIPVPGFDVGKNNVGAGTSSRSKIKNETDTLNLKSIISITDEELILNEELLKHNLKSLSTSLIYRRRRRRDPLPSGK